MMLRNPKQAIGAGLALLLAAIVSTLAQAAVGTPILEAPQRLEWPARMATLPKPLMPSVADWNADGIPEVLCSDGSGALCLLFVKVTPNEARVTKAEPVLAMGKPLNTGGAAKPNFVDFNGDGLKDLVIEDMKGRTLRVYPNTGSKESTTLGAFLCARIGEATGTGGDGLLRLPSGADGRVAVADWDSDGKPDVVYGMFSGDLMVFRNKGVAAKPLFPASSEPIKGPNGAIMEAYGPYPCVLDVNGDGAVDLTFGLNWGCIISYLNNAPSGAPRLVERVKARKPDLSDWEPHLSPDNYAPSDFADFDGDGTLDAVFGGYSGGSLFVARGRGLGHTLERLDQALMGEGNVVLARLAQDRILRQQLLAQHVLLNYYAHWLTGPGTARPELFKGLLAHCRARPYLYGDHSISPVDYEGLPWVSAQARSTLRCLAGREPANWTAIADGLQLSPLRAAIVRDTGVVVLDNSAFWEPQLTFLHALLTSVPAAINHLQ
ncbi:MAG: VCBS repeat-containing protein, partial [Armatimonadota bacterium]